MSHRNKLSGIILGSSAKQRHQALEEAGIKFTVELPEIDEKAVTHDMTYLRPKYIAKAKSEAIRKKLAAKHIDRGVLIAVDTVIFYGKILREKPENHTQLLEWVREYGRSRMPIEVVTGMAAFNLSNGKEAADIDISRIFFKPYPEQDAKYITHSNTFLAYAGGVLPRHEIWKRWIDRIEGGPGSEDAMPLNLLDDLVRQVI